MEEEVGPPPRADCDRSWVNMEGAHTGMEEGVGPSPKADCDHSWVNMEGAQTDIGEGVGPPLKVGCYQSWASLGHQLTYMYIPGVQSFESMGAKV